MKFPVKRTLISLAACLFLSGPVVPEPLRTSGFARSNAATAVESTLSSPRIVRLRNEFEKDNKRALDEFWEEVSKQGSPLVEKIEGDQRNLLITFVWRASGETKNVVVFSPIGEMEPSQGLMQRLLDSDLWYKTYRVRSDARFSYSISPNDSLVSFSEIENPRDFLGRTANWRPDPFNKKQFYGFPKASSVVELPDAPPQPWLVRDPDVPAGATKQHRFKSQILNNERNLWVYTPPDYKADGPPYGLIVIFDGQAYTVLVPTGLILNNMIAKGVIPPLVAVVVDNVTPESRDTEMACNPSFADSLSKELVPWIRQHYNVTSDPARTIVAGSSYGGLAASYAGFRHPEVFGNVLSQSGSYWWKPDGDAEHEWLARQIVASQKLPVRFYLEIGLFEIGATPGKGPSMVVTNRHLRDVLMAKGYEVHYGEFAGGHEYLNWRGTFSNGLLALIGKNAR